MKAPALARILGVAFLLAGALGLAPFATVPAPLTAEYITLGGHYAYLFGFLPVNGLHDFLHIVFGGWGILASFGFKGSLIYLRSIAWIYLVLVVLGTIPITDTIFGAVPIYGFDVLLHLFIALVALYGGYGAGSRQPPPPPEFAL
jgi:hypothetical protein